VPKPPRKLISLIFGIASSDNQVGGGLRPDDAPGEGGDVN
jgi:hypothetical protein